jgi:hypothetical protein
MIICCIGARTSMTELGHWVTEWLLGGDRELLDVVAGNSFMFIAM